MFCPDSLRSIRFGKFVTIGLICMAFGLLAGCQKLFHDEGAILKGQTVTVGVTVPETPPPAVKPVQVTKQESAAEGVARIKPVDTQFLPTQEPSRSLPAFSPAPTTTVVTDTSQRVRTQITRGDTVLSGKLITEDTVLRGSVVVKGSLIVAPQATLRLEAGTQLRFAGGVDSAQRPRLVVQGRLVCAGTAERPVLLSAAFDEARPGDWGGVVLLGSEKKNSLDHCRIEGAETGLDARQSQVTARHIAITRCLIALALHDSTASLTAIDLSRSDIGLQFIDSELELRDAKLWENRQGALGIRSTCTLSSLLLQRNSQEGLAADQCRYRVIGSSAVENRIGIYLKDGEGQIQQSRFSRNREAGLMVAGSKLRVQQSSFQGNLGVGLRLDSTRGMAINNAFSLNEGGNLVITGNESFVALLNWWGGSDERQIAAGISGRVPYAPFLTSRPALAP